jgi:sugar lactone lactonase YvrE
MTRTRSLALFLAAALACSSTTGRADTLYVNLINSNTIVTYNTAATNPTPMTFASTGPSGAVGLAFDKAGNLYTAVANFSNFSGTITKYTPQGVGSLFASTPPGVGTAYLAFDAAGNLFASGSTFSDTIAKFTPQGVFSLFASTGLHTPDGMAFDTAGNLYVANANGNDILKFTPGGAVSVFASTGSFNVPIGLAFDAAGNLFATESNNTIEKFTPQGVGSLFASTGLNDPVGLAFDAAGDLFVANPNDDSIEKFTPQGVGSGFATTPGTPFDLVFAPSAIPEPSSLVLGCLAVALLGSYGAWRRARRASQPCAPA